LKEDMKKTYFLFSATFVVLNRMLLQNSSWKNPQKNNKKQNPARNFLLLELFFGVSSLLNAYKRLVKSLYKRSKVVAKHRAHM